MVGHNICLFSVSLKFEIVQVKVLLDSHYAPSLTWWTLAANADEILIEKKSYYRKGSYRNRCHIFGANGLLRLSIPLQRGKHQRSIIDEVQISNDHPWQKIHWESLCAAYRSSPYFEFYEHEFETFYTQMFESLFDFNDQLMRLIASLMSLPTPMECTGSFKLDYRDELLDFREVVHPNPNKQPEKLKFNFEEYIQVFSAKSGFIADLSILDLLFNLGPASLEYLKKIGK